MCTHQCQSTREPHKQKRWYLHRCQMHSTSFELTSKRQKSWCAKNSCSSAVSNASRIVENRILYNICPKSVYWL